MSGKTTLIFGLSILAMGCSSPAAVTIGSGTYTIVDADALTPVAEFENVLVEIDVAANEMTVTWMGEEDDVVWLTGLELRAESDWKEDCPTNFSATPQQTFDLADPLTLGDETLDNAFIFGAGCEGDKDAAFVWLSTASHDAETAEIGTGLHYLKAMAGE
mgnify:CR=1 FL=1